MAFISLIRDLDSVIKASPFKDGQLAVAYDKDRLYIDVLNKNNQQKRVYIDNESIKDQKSDSLVYLWIGSQAEYEALTPSNDTLYITTDDGIDLSVQGEITATITSSSIIYSLDGRVSTQPFLKLVLS